MANKKFSEFVLKTDTSDVSHIVGYNGAENVQITPANFVTGGGTGVFLPLAGGTMTGNTIHNDNVKSIYGNPGNDLQIYHDSSNSYIQDAGAGRLILQTNYLEVQNAAGTEAILEGIEDGAVNLYFNSSKKFETSSTGISVTGGGLFTGSVGIGGAADNLLTLQGTAGDTHQRFKEGSTTIGFIGGATGIIGSQDGKLAIRAEAGLVLSSQGNNVDVVIDSGNVGIGTATPGNYRLNVSKGAVGDVAQITDGVANTFIIRTDANTLYTGNANNLPLAFLTNNTEKMRLDASGNFLLGKTALNVGTAGAELRNNGQCIFTADGDNALDLNRLTNDGQVANFRQANTVVGSISVTGSATAFNTTSDYRLKEDLQDFKGLELVSKIPVYDYKWKADESRSYGVMAHELQEVLPQAVSGDKDAEEMQSVDYSKIVPLLVKSIQELSAKLEALKCQCEKK